MNPATAPWRCRCCLISHQPLDLVIIMLGTNDIKFAARCRAFDAAMGMERLIQIVKNANYVKGFKNPKS